MQHDVRYQKVGCDSTQLQELNPNLGHWLIYLPLPVMRSGDERRNSRSSDPASASNHFGESAVGTMEQNWVTEDIRCIRTPVQRSKIPFQQERRQRKTVISGIFVKCDDIQIQEGQHNADHAGDMAKHVK